MNTRQLTRKDLPRKTNGRSLHIKVMYHGRERVVCDIHYSDAKLCYLEDNGGLPVKIADLQLIIDDKKSKVMKKEYFLIHFGEDGITIEPKTKAEINRFLEDMAADGPGGEENFMDGSYDRYEMRGEYPIYKYLIIKGEAVIPQIVKTVTELKLP
jgi:hypothetical protein